MTATLSVAAFQVEVDAVLVARDGAQVGRGGRGLRVEHGAGGAELVRAHVERRDAGGAEVVGLDERGHVERLAEAIEVTVSL